LFGLVGSGILRHSRWLAVILLLLLPSRHILHTAAVPTLLMVAAVEHAVNFLAEYRWHVFFPLSHHWHPCHPVILLLAATTMGGVGIRHCICSLLEYGIQVVFSVVHYITNAIGQQLPGL